MNTTAPPDSHRLNSLFALVALIVLFVLVHWMLWYYLELDFDAQKILAETATGGVIGVIYGVLPSLNKRFLQLRTRRLLASPGFLKTVAALCAAIFLSGILVNRTQIRWPAGQTEIEVNGKPIGSDSWTETAANSTSVYGIVFQSKSLRVGDYSQVLRFRPLVPLTYDVPETAVFSSKPEYQQIVTLLALAFFQSTENKFLTEAKSRFDSDQTRKFVDLNSVYQILKLCFTENDIARIGDKTLLTFQQQRPNSTWIPLLRSCQHYSRAEFDQAVSDIEKVPANTRSPLLDAYAFFRGVNYLKGFILLSNGVGRRDTNLLQKARANFVLADKTSRMSNDEYFQQIARRSAQIFQGITFVYEHDNDKAFDAFKEAAKSTYPELRARALSDLGYVSLLRGNLPDAKAYFVSALEADPSFPYAETNLGYAYLSEGRYDAARDLFARLAKDENLKKNSARDVILSELAIAHIDAEKDALHAPNPDAYSVPLKEMGIFDYEGLDPPLLRLATIRLALADRIYMSHDYYGLEMFALAMYARAYREASSLKGSPQAALVAQKSLAAFRTVAQTIDPRCFIFHTNEGFFKPVAILAVEEGLTK